MLPRILLAFTAVALLFGGVVHANAFNKAVTALSAVSLPAFYANSFKALWLIDSVTLISLAVLFAVIAVWPSLVTRWIVILLAIIPAGTAALIYNFVGSFFPAHLLAVCTVLTIIAGLQFPSDVK